MLALALLSRNLFLAAVIWIGSVSQFRRCMPKTVPFITPFKVSCSPSVIHHFTHPSLPPLYPGYSHPAIFCSARPLHHSVHPALPPTCLFLPCLARNHPADSCEWDGSVCISLCTLSEFCVCVLRWRGGRGSGLRMWARCLRTLMPPPSLTGFWQSQVHKGWLIERDSEGSVETYTLTTMAL